ncbi:ABC-type uncharacterized transport system, periplasmic component [Beggiatoa alba B18LD]|uniref:ABC-type uncharacterized transport system, periplasmic component n=1 Tax=Beggiatoa alba B18LD TaxID=395493 RepID=I3CHG5_9GAMM|nr:ABC transporter substrate binding protein [Beggiatoa alba]EIJ43058.1 ABC-type uncharacterized transport system, periplasmic component [Beggiatoa alba B18LD]
MLKILILLLLACSSFSPWVLAASNYTGKKVLHVASYHSSFEWVTGLNHSIETVFKDKGIDFQVFYMDTKNHPTEAWKQEIALKAKDFIETFKPNIVIASDDDAAKYLIVPYYKESNLPFIFCGINEDIKVYGFPTKNMTGMLEVDLADVVVAHLRKYAKGNRVAILTVDGMSERKLVQNYIDVLKLPISHAYFVKTFEEWKTAFLMTDADMLLLINYVGLEGWDTQTAIQFVEQNAHIPIGANFSWLKPFALLGITKLAEEQGTWSAQAALKIMDGVQPNDIPIAKNKDGRLFINLRIANKLGVVFNKALLQTAEIIN